MEVPKEVLCEAASRSSRGCYGYGKTTFKAVIPWDMCKICPEYSGNKGKIND